MSLIGKKIDDFSVQSYHKGEFKQVTQKDIEGKWSVFFFYPADFTFVCPTELGDLADNYAAFKEANTEIYSVSTDTHFVHKAWADSSSTIEKIEFPMLADPRAILTKFFDVYIEDEGLALRGSFIVNPSGIIKAFEVHDLGIGRDADELLRKVLAAQFVEAHGDQVCPAKWKPGKSTLTPGIDLVGKI